MFESKSDYALNKLDPEAIVCKSVTGVHIRLTREDFSSEEEFRRWKKLSDGDYKDRESAGRGFYDYCVSLGEAWNTTGVSTEDVLLASLLKAEREEQQAALLQQVKSILTETQYRRLWMYFVDGLSVEQIAQRDDVRHQSVSECLSLALEKIVNSL